MVGRIGACGSWSSAAASPGWRRRTGAGQLRRRRRSWWSSSRRPSAASCARAPLRRRPRSRPGAEAFLVRDPQTGEPSPALELARRARARRRRWCTRRQPGRARRRRRAASRCPAGTLVGVPADRGRVADRAGRARPRRRAPAAGARRGRRGRRAGAARGSATTVVDRLVDPMLGGVYAGRADDLSLAATMPGARTRRAPEYHDAHRRGAVRRSRPAPAGRAARVRDRPRRAEPHLVERGRRGSAPTAVATGRPVRELAAPADGLAAHRRARPATRRRCTADAVVLAVPARPAARLLAERGRRADARRAGLRERRAGHARAAARPRCPSCPASWCRRPRAYADQGGTFFTRKWAHLRRPGRTLVRVSLGRYGEEGVLQRPDDDLVGTGARPSWPTWSAALPRRPVDVGRCTGGAARCRSTRPGTWTGSRRRGRRCRAGLALAGAAFDGVGIPACVRVRAERPPSSCGRWRRLRQNRAA